MNLLLLGKDGQVGSELQRTLLPFGKLTAIGRASLCLEDLIGLTQLLDALKPQIIVNAAAYTAVDKAESEPKLSLLINASVVEVLANYAKKNNALLVHYSTDYVFDGEKTTAYQEEDAVNPQNSYGISKRAGEVAIQASGCKHLIFRTSWVFSAKGNNFIKTIFKLAREKTQLKVVADQFGAPTSAELIADITALAIAAFNNNRLSTGLYHLSATGSTNWYNLAYYALNKALSQGFSFALDPKNIQAISTEEYPLPAKRPKNSQLNVSALSSALQLTIPEWTVHVDRLIEQLSRLENTL